MHGRGRAAAFPCIGECGYGDWADACHWNSASTDEFGWIQYMVYFPDAGFGKQRQIA